MLSHVPWPPPGDRAILSQLLSQGSMGDLLQGLGGPGQELGLGTSNRTQSSSSRRMEAFSPSGTQASWEEATEITQVPLSRTVAVSVPALSLTHTQGRQPVDLLAKCKNQWQDGKRPLNCGC